MTSEIKLKIKKKGKVMQIMNPLKAGRGLILVLLAVWVCFVCGCVKKEETKKVDLSKIEEIKKTVEVPDSSLKVAVSAMISPKETFVSYQAILDYLGRKLGKAIKLVQRETYAEVNDLIEKQEIDVAFVCSGPYIQGKKKFGMELVATPVIYGEPLYYSYVIVHKDSPIKDFTELKGMGFAFTDAYSNTGCLVPRYELSKMGQTADVFFKSYIFTKSHDNSIKAVAEKIADGAAVDNLIWEYINATNPVYTSQTKVIAKIGPFGAPPVVIHPAFNPETKQQIQQIFLSMHEDEEGRAILKQIFIDKFIIVGDSHYDSVRKMQEWLDRKG